jgi:hypothetical protein
MKPYLSGASDEWVWAIENAYREAERINARRGLR